jgi:hypothetical protein
VRFSVRGVSVRDVMTPTPEPRAGWVTVDAYLERFVDGLAVAPDVFVIERWEGGAAGIVTLDRVRAVPPHARSSTRVVELAVALERLRVSSPADDLADAWSQPGSGVVVLPHLAVLERGRVVGVVTPDAVEHAAATRRSVSRVRGRP